MEYNFLLFVYAVGFGLIPVLLLSSLSVLSFKLLSFKLHPKIIAAILLQLLLGGRKKKAAFWVLQT